MNVHPMITIGKIGIFKPRLPFTGSTAEVANSLDTT